MSTRSTRSMVTFSNTFALSGYLDVLLAGEHEAVVEEELPQGFGFEAYRKTATFLTVHDRGGHSGRSEMRKITETNLELALSRDRVFTRNNKDSDAALSPQEDLK